MEVVPVALLPYETDFGESRNIFVQAERRRDKLEVGFLFYWKFIASYIIIVKGDDMCSTYQSNEKDDKKTNGAHRSAQRRNESYKNFR